MKKSVLALAVTAALASTATFAAVDDNPTGWYVGGGFGRFNLNVDGLGDFGTGVNRALDDNDNTYKFFAGYRFIPWLSVEAAYVNLGKPGDQLSTSGSSGRYSLKADGFEPSLVGWLPLGPVELSAKVGYFYYDVDVRSDLNNPGRTFVSGHSRNDFTYGAGVGMTFFDHLHVKAEYQRFNLKNYDGSDAVWLTGAWRF
ncbi:MAG: hypothetical protein EOP08_08480 [Proteobacteria bacterium]|nr:MAG: hypothetical protein EOP08_08480 [Pseudomonadota bacterium]